MWFYLIPSIDGVITGNLYLNDNMHGSLCYLIMWLKLICCLIKLKCCPVKLSIHRHSIDCYLQCSLCSFRSTKTAVLTFATIMIVSVSHGFLMDYNLFLSEPRWGLCISRLRPIDNPITALFELTRVYHSFTQTISHKPLISARVLPQMLILVFFIKF